jgi:hypothetical protein
MKRKGALVVVALFIALCGSACSNFLLNGIAGSGGSSGAATTYSMTATLKAVPDRLLVDRSGTGNTLLGAFQLHGRIYYGVSCKGHGQLEVDVNSTTSLGTRCPLFGLGQAPGSTLTGRARFSVRAPSHVRWRIEIYEKPAR